MLAYVLIGFACGFLCRQVIWLEQKRQSRIRYEKEMQQLQVNFEKIKKDIRQAMKEINK